MQYKITMEIDTDEELMGWQETGLIKDLEKMLKANDVRLSSGVVEVVR